MNKIEIYTKAYCPYCHRAKAVLDSKGVQYKEIDISTDTTLQAEMIKRSNRRTVPQIFIDGEHIGGSDDLMRIKQTGELDKLIAKEAELAAQ